MEVVIIGAGMGGLFCGALLAKRGIRVTVLEKNSSIGGGLQTFVRGGETYETGMHVAGGFNEGGILNSICHCRKAARHGPHKFDAAVVICYFNFLGMGCLAFTIVQSRVIRKVCSVRQQIYGSSLIQVFRVRYY